MGGVIDGGKKEEGQNLAWRRNSDSMIRHKNCVGLFLRTHQVMVPAGRKRATTGPDRSAPLLGTDARGRASPTWHDFRGLKLLSAIWVSIPALPVIASIHPAVILPAAVAGILNGPKAFLCSLHFPKGRVGIHVLIGPEALFSSLDSILSRNVRVAPVC